MKQILSILLSFILMASHLYLTLGIHFCGGTAVEAKIMIGEKNLSCGKMVMVESCEDAEHSNHNQVSFDKVPCCQDVFQTIQSTDDFVKDAAKTTFNADLAVAFIYATLHFDLFPETTQRFYTDYYSPPIEKDVQVLFQTFLI